MIAPVAVSNTASTESPAMSMTRPCLDSICSLNTERAASSAATVALSSAAIRREYPATSAARIAARRCLDDEPCARERGGELIAAPGDGGDRLRAEQPAQRADLHLQVVFLDHQAGPDQIQQLRLGHDPVAPLGQCQKQVERARSQAHRLAVVQQSSLPRLQFEAAEFQRRGIVHLADYR